MRALAALFCWLIALPAAAFTPGQQVLALNPQAARVAGVAMPYTFNWQKGGYPYSNGTCATYGHVVPCRLTTTRATPSNAMVNTRDGYWVPVAANLPRITNSGLLVEEARTNSALWSRDMTNVVWATVTMGTALNAIGIDASANAATTLTATAGNATILQTTALGAGTDSYSVFLKRVTGTGTINITGNAGVAWTACPALNATSFTRCSLIGALGLNPVIGLQIVTNGDAVIADANQLEAGASTTSPVFTTTVAVPRAVDVDIMTYPPTFGGAYTIYAKGTPQAPNTYSASQTIIATIFDASNRLSLRRGATAALNVVTTGGGGTITPSGTWNQNTSGKFAAAFTDADAAAVFNGGTPATAVSTPLPTTPTSVIFGAATTGPIVPWNGFLEQAAILPATRITNGRLQSMTAGAP